MVLFVQMDILIMEVVVAGAPGLHSLLPGHLCCLQNLASTGTPAPHGEVNQANDNRQMETFSHYKLISSSMSPPRTKLN